MTSTASGAFTTIPPQSEPLSIVRPAMSLEDTLSSSAKDRVPLSKRSAKR